MAPRQSWEWAGSCCKSNAMPCVRRRTGAYPKAAGCCRPNTLPSQGDRMVSHFADRTHAAAVTGDAPARTPEWSERRAEIRVSSAEAGPIRLRPSRRLLAAPLAPAISCSTAWRRCGPPAPKRSVFSTTGATRRLSNRHWPAPSSSIPTCRSGCRPRPFRSSPRSPMPGGHGLRPCSIRHRRSLPASTGRRSWMRMPASIRRRKSDPCV